jgi:hypothetical protein
MSRLAHTTAGAPGMEAERRELADIAQHEIREAHRIQAQLRCSWDEALRLAYQQTRKENA